MKNPIIEAFNFTIWTMPPDSEDEIIRKVVGDNLIGLRAQELMIRFFAAEAIKGLRPVERDALLKRMGYGPRPAQHHASWIVEPGLHSGKPTIRGTCGRCGNDCLFTGTPDVARSTVWAHCTVGPSRIPEAIIEEYKGRFGFTS